ncbi:MocR-like pyridoxine biosynthesis transcription factor PdxR [Salmonella bongori]|uniref:MocR-like pyridoxine biosynthesis transcription factor PdxR n=1 Tax=Salmonella bongori TaxID=54736 RepID=UPI0009A9D788|nr:PLP-dependent aminotransferase family protein [Salmonella bongori]EHM2229360.1 PLP-dependent aminotransferase family protein [Salmonella bongori]EIT4620557.1 PLP-dependent aminotransferase family protein [Salmonella bongori]
MRALVGDLLLVRMQQEQNEFLHKRLYNALRHAILDGSLPPHSRLPASRDLASELGISRNTILTTYEQLLAEGYVVSRRGSGTYVAQTAPDTFLTAISGTENCADVGLSGSVSQRGRYLLQHVSASPRQWGAFIPGVPDVNAFPHPLFSKIQARISRRPKPERLSYSCNGGAPELQHALVDYLRVARGVRCHADQILITEGIHQAIDLVTRMLADAGDMAWVEEPSYWGIRHVLAMNAMRITPVAVDANGMAPPERSQDPPRLIFVTPSHQYPLGAVMSLERRQRLLALARQYGSWIVEDDYDSEFRFSGQPIPALQGLIPDAPVVYIGTFSKTLYPGLRLGYLVLPRPLIDALKSAHAELYRGGHSLIQMALAEFINGGHYSAHIRRMRLLYSRRRAFLSELIERHCGAQALSDFSDNAGLHLILNLPDEVDDVAVAARANAQNILVRPLSRYYLTTQRKKGLLMGFACLTEAQMEPAFATLLTCLHPHCPQALITT